MSTAGCYKGRQEIRSTPFKFAEFTLTKADAQTYLYADSAKHRVHKWKDVKVALYI